MKILAAFLGAVLAYPAVAQEIPPIELVMENLGRSASACGVDKSGIEAAARSSARYNRIKLVSNSEYRLYLSINVFDSGDRCAVNINVEVSRPMVSKLGNRDKGATVVFCHAGDLGVISKFSAMSSVSDQLKQSIDRCLSQL